MLIGAVDDRRRVYLDTVSVLRGMRPELPHEFIVGVLTIRATSWLAHRLSFGAAERTMHLDHWALGRVRVPMSLLGYANEIPHLLCMDGDPIKSMGAVDEILASVFALDGEEMDFILSFYPPW